jgi:hypothetical protein
MATVKIVDRSNIYTRQLTISLILVIIRRFFWYNFILYPTILAITWTTSSKRRLIVDEKAFFGTSQKATACTLFDFPSFGQKWCNWRMADVCSTNHALILLVGIYNEIGRRFYRVAPLIANLLTKLGFLIRSFVLWVITVQVARVSCSRFVREAPAACENKGQVRHVDGNAFEAARSLIFINTGGRTSHRHRRHIKKGLINFSL